MTKSKIPKKLINPFSVISLEDIVGITVGFKVNEYKHTKLETGTELFEFSLIKHPKMKKIKNSDMYEIGVLKPKKILKNKSIGYNKKAKLPLSSAMKDHVRNKAVGIGKETITGTPKEIIKKSKSKNK